MGKFVNMEKKIYLTKREELNDMIDTYKSQLFSTQEDSNEIFNMIKQFEAEVIAEEKEQERLKEKNKNNKVEN